MWDSYHDAMPMSSPEHIDNRDELRCDLVLKPFPNFSQILS